MSLFLFKSLLPTVASMAVKSALGSYAKGSAAVQTAKAAAGVVAATMPSAGVVAATMPSGIVAGALAAYALYMRFREKSPWFERKNEYNEEDIERYLNFLLDDIGVSLEDIDNSNELIKNIIDEIRSFASSNDEMTVADGLEAILVHVEKELAEVRSRLPPETQAELRSRKKPRPQWNDEGARLEGETPPQFIKRVYADLLAEKKLSRNQLRTLDSSLYTALANWLRKNNMPADLDLPTKSEVIDRGGDLDPEQVREARRVLSLWTYRTQRAAKDRNR